jgi:hypothetical protein
MRREIEINEGRNQYWDSEIVVSLFRMLVGRISPPSPKSAGVYQAVN